MVDTQRAAVLHVSAQQIDKRLVGTRRHHVWIHRRQAPVLTKRAQNIRRRTDGGFQTVKFTVTPGLRPAFRHADGQIAIQTDRHVIALAHLPAGSKLAVRQPLQPEIEIHLVGMRLTKRLHFRGIHGLIRFRPHRPAPAHLILLDLIRMQRIKRRLPVKALAFLHHKLAEGCHLLVVTLRKALPGQTQRRHFQRGHGGIIDPVRIAGLFQHLLGGVQLPPRLRLFAVFEIV
ncbi:Uncharacterised protein [Enterobacter hormaechei]|nr:Uncharacterised protein [Enterobacter hormaechei]